MGARNEPGLQPLPAATGILAVWNDCKAGCEAEYERWYVGEHLPERVAIPGFRLGRRYISMSGREPRYFTYYETDTPAVLTSATYRARLENPTPQTRQIMTGIFENMCRTVCRRSKVEGAGRGAFAVAARLATDAGGDVERLWPELVAIPALLRSEVWDSAETGPAEPSAEERLRGRDRKIAGCIFLEFGFEAGARNALRAVEGLLSSGAASVDLYQLICSLDAGDLAARTQTPINR